MLRNFNLKSLRPTLFSEDLEVFIEWINVLRFAALCTVLRLSVRAMHNHSFPTVIQFY